MWKIAGFLTLLLVWSGVDSAERTSRPNAVGCEELFPVQCEQSKLDVSFVIDASSSIGRENFTRCLNFVEDFVGFFDVPTVHVSLITFAGVADENNAFGFDDHLTMHELKHAIANTHYTEYRYTNTSAGLNYMREHQLPHARPGVRHIVIVITDGRSQETSKTKAAAEAVLATGVEVFAIGVGSGVHYPELVTIAGDGRHVFEAESYAILHTITERLLFQSCAVPTMPECEMDPVELAFVIDTSSSLGDEAYHHCMDFVMGLVEKFKVDQQHVRIAAITFDLTENPGDAIQFDEHDSAESVRESLQSIVYHAGRYTNTSAGINYMREVLMAKARHNTAKISIVITDGNSQETSKTKAAAEAARGENILMYAVGVGAGVAQSELMNIAGDENRILRAEEYEELNVIKDELVNVTCQGILNSIGSHGGDQMRLYHTTLAP